jgi:hypothetical protein
MITVFKVVIGERIHRVGDGFIDAGGPARRLLPQPEGEYGGKVMDSIHAVVADVR